MMRFTFIRATFLLLFTALFALAPSASLPPTLAWDRVFGDGDYAQGMDTDASGNLYFSYSSGSTLHLVKMSPAMGVIWDKTNTFADRGFPQSVVVSPMIAGTQFVYVVANNHVVSSDTYELWAKKYDTNGVPQWNDQPYVVYDEFDNVQPIGLHADAAGNVYFAMWRWPFLEMDKVDASGASVGGGDDFSMLPSAAFFNEVSNQWVVAGSDRLAPTGLANNSVRWSSYDPSNGAVAFTHYADATNNTVAGTTSAFSIALSQLPGGRIGIGLNESRNGPSGPSSGHHLLVTDAYDQGLFLYPVNPYNLGVGSVGQMAAFSTASPLYVLGNDGTSTTVKELDWLGQPIWTHTHQPVGTIYPSADGFYSLQFVPNTVVFLEHYNESAGAYDWGQSYVGENPGRNSYAGLKIFQNFFYVITSSYRAASQYDVFVDRFVNGVCLQRITCVRAVYSLQKLPVTIYLNAPAPAGGMSVALNSSSNALLLPNRTRGQNFLIPAGSTALTVYLEAQPVLTDTPVTLLAIQNGVRRTAAVTVRPN